jgi:mRNA-degrading endonuclease RelE of RelBE toxin-antitoxin system
MVGRRGSYRILYETQDDVPEVSGKRSADAGFVRVVDVDNRMDVYRRR